MGDETVSVKEDGWKEGSEGREKGENKKKSYIHSMDLFRHRITRSCHMQQYE